MTRAVAHGHVYVEIELKAKVRTILILIIIFNDLITSKLNIIVIQIEIVNDCCQC